MPNSLLFCVFQLEAERNASILASVGRHQVSPLHGAHQLKNSLTWHRKLRSSLPLPRVVVTVAQDKERELQSQLMQARAALESMDKKSLSEAQSLHSFEAKELERFEVQGFEPTANEVLGVVGRCCGYPRFFPLWLRAVVAG
jgi:hypothetical protein